MMRLLSILLFLSLNVQSQVVVFGVNVTPGTPVPAISVSPSSLTGFETEEGTASTYQTATVSGTNLTANITVTAPADFEVSLSSGSGYGASVSITQSSGTAASTTVYIRIKSSAEAGSVSGNVACTSSGASTKNIAVSGTVTAVEEPAGDTTLTVLGQFNCYGEAQSISGWVDLSPNPAQPHSTVKSGTDGTVTLSTNTTSAWNGLPATSGSSGTTVDDGGGFYHNEAANDTYLFNYNDTYSGSTDDACFKVSGLTEDSIYVVEIVGSREPSQGDRFSQYLMHDKDGAKAAVTTWWTGGTVNAKSNTSKYVRLFGKADASGNIYVWGGGTTNAGATTQYAYFNTIRIYKATIN